MIGAALVLALAMQDAVEVPAPRRARTVQSSVRILIEESPQGEYPHDYYEQPFPSQVRTGSTLLGSEVWYKTLCRPQDEDRRPLFVPPPEPPLPLTVSGVLGSPQISIGDGGATLIGGNPRRDPGSSGTRTAKAAIFSGGSSDSGSSDTDSPFLYGTDLDYVVAPDVTGWSPLRWLPEETSFHLYGRALFGSLEIFDVSTDIQLYGVGPRLGVPIARGDGVRLEGTISAGPAFLHTGIGDAVGFDGGVGLSFSLILSRGLSLIAEIEANLYLSDHVTAFGPVLNLGFNLAW
jgi:hypothetical protein